MNASCQDRHSRSLEPQIDVHHGGTDREYGVAIGSQLRSRILRAREGLATYESFVRGCPWWMPFWIYDHLARRRACSTLRPRFSKCFPHMVERIDGMADGSKTSVDFLYLFHAMESLTLSATEPVQPAMAGCTAVAVNDQPSRKAYIAHNFDLVDLASELMAIREYEGGNGYRSLGFTLAPMAGIVDGINEAGLAISYNYAPATDVKFADPPLSFAIEETLTSCATVARAVRRLAKLPRSGGGLLMLADATGQTAALEVSANHCKIRKPKRKQRVIHHSNAYRTRRMRRYEPSRTAVYADDAPESLRNVPVFQSADRRDQRLAQHFGNGQVYRRPSELEAIMSDHGPDRHPGSDTICMHGGYWSTIASVQMFPCERRLRISYGPACQATFRDFIL